MFLCVCESTRLIIAGLQGLSYAGDPRPQSNMLFVCLVEPEFTSKSNLHTTFTQIHVCNLGSTSPKQTPRDITPDVNIHDRFLPGLNRGGPRSPSLAEAHGATASSFVDGEEVMLENKK